ncbi:DUF1700 domain-containing protein [Bacillus sp. 2205SS5-2]|uniref:DUF1700 domain-containing protein n=1 Tax=Bacillus sp. 2205SS5-2 TaxID=3109031 RepID=UPI00300612EA
MTKEEYLQRLELALFDLPTERQKEIMDHYNRRIELGFSYEKEVEEMMEYLGTPEEVAAKIWVEEKEKKAPKETPSKPLPPPSSGSKGTKIMLILLLILFNLIFVLGPAIGIGATILGFCVSAIALIVSGVLVLIVDPLSILFGFDVEFQGLTGWPRGLGLLFTSMTTVGFGLVLGAVSTVFAKGYVWLFKKYGYWMGKVVRGD